VLVFRTKREQHAVAAAQRFEQEVNQALRWDRQRPNIHTALVCERLVEVQAKITQFVQLADPRPDTEPDSSR
jgi:hypothetical protein